MRKGGLRFGGPTSRDRAILFRGLGMLFSNGVPLFRALELLANQAEHPELARACRGISKRMQHGTSLSASFSAHSEVFRPIQLRLLQVGEMTGALAVIFQRLADFEEKQDATGQRLQSMLTYPALVMLLCVAVVVLLPPYLFGSMSGLLQGVKLPLLTRVVWAMSNAMRSPLFWVGGVALLFLSGWALARYLAHSQGRRRVLQLAMLPPGLGPALRALAVTRFARALEVMLGVGIPLHQALPLAGQASGNLILAESCQVAVSQILNGATVAEALGSTGFFPGLFVQTVTAGEESGALAKMLRRIADLYDLELQSRLEILLALLEPLVIGVMGAVAALLIIATALPMLQVIQSL